MRVRHDRQRERSRCNGRKYRGIDQMDVPPWPYPTMEVAGELAERLRLHGERSAIVVTLRGPRQFRLTWYRMKVERSTAPPELTGHPIQHRLRRSILA